MRFCDAPGQADGDAAAAETPAAALVLTPAPAPAAGPATLPGLPLPALVPLVPEAELLARQVDPGIRDGDHGRQLHPRRGFEVLELHRLPVVVEPSLWSSSKS